MTRSKEKAERSEKAIALANVSQAGRALLVNNEQEFFRLFPACDVSLKFTYRRIFDSKEVEFDLFSAACDGIATRKKDDLATLVVERMIAEGIDLRVHRTNRFLFTPLMVAAMHCGRNVVSLVLPFSDPAATTIDGSTAAELARANQLVENADLIDAFILGGNEAKIMGNDIPIPPPGPRNRIGLR